LPTEPDRPRASGRGGKTTGARVGGSAPGRRPPRPSTRVLRGILDEVAAARGALAIASDSLRAVDARVRSWDHSPSDSFLARRAHALHDEATARFAASLDQLHALLLRLADRSDPTLGPAASPRLRAAGTRRLQARVRRELRGLQRAYEGGGALLSRTLVSFDG
jgi:hypothetical protein